MVDLFWATFPVSHSLQSVALSMGWKVSCGQSWHVGSLCPLVVLPKVPGGHGQHVFLLAVKKAPAKHEVHVSS